MTTTLILQILETLTEIVGQVAPLLAQSQAVLSETDAAKIHAALVQAEQATAALKSQVDAALAMAVQN